MHSSSSHHQADFRLLLSAMRNSAALRRLLAVRLTSQLTDGIFQAGLITAILFNPDDHADPLVVAGGFAVLLLPYSILGPFVGGLLDHWDRRNVLVFANILRAVLIGTVSLSLVTDAPQSVVLICALAVTGASRFVASGLSAGLPHLVDRDVIVGINAVFTTLGAAILGVGAGIALGLRAIFGADHSGSALTILAGALIALIAAALAHGFARLQLGPDAPDDPGSSAPHAIAVGMWHGFRAVAHSNTTSAALTAIGFHRLVFGINTLLVLVLGQEMNPGGDGLGVVSLVALATAGGALLAAVTTPISVDRAGRRTTLLIALGIGMLAELSLLSFNIVVLGIAAFFLGLCGQTVKLCGDVAMQVDIPDQVRGQVFSVQDAVFNVAYVAALFFASITIPTDGHSTLLPALCGLLYLAGILMVRVLYGPQHHPPPTSDSDSLPPASQLPS